MLLNPPILTKTVGYFSLKMWFTRKIQDKVRILSINDGFFWMLPKKYCIIAL